MPEFQSLDDEQSFHDRMLEGMEQQVRDLFNQLYRLDHGLPLLRFLDANANTLMTIEDIEYFLKRPRLALEPCLYTLVDLGLARWVKVAGFVFFGLTSDRERRRLARDLVTWQDHWRARMVRIGVFDSKPQPQFLPPSL